MTLEPDRVWWTAAELAQAGLPDVPASKRRVNAVVEREGWAADPQRSRRRAGRGGGWEYHWTLLPARAQKRLLAQAHPSPVPPAAPGRDEAWDWYEAQPQAVKDAAEARRRALDMAAALEAGGHSRALALAEAGVQAGVSVRTMWSWLGAVEGVRPDDWLPRLAPRHRLAARGGPRVACSPEWWDALRADYLRLERPSFATCWRRAQRLAEANGWDVLPERTARRRLEAEVSRPVRVLARKGSDALAQLYPAQRRDRTALVAMEAVNADFHRFDLFVAWPAVPGSAGPEVARPQMVAFQDIYSGRILSWRVDRTPNREAVRLCLGDMIEEFGIPGHVLFDNGREFANKLLTGRAETRFRFTIRDDDPVGIIQSLGIELHWATPYSGQSKPIERAFRDMCDAIARDPRFEGAWTGNRPDAKPENYASAAIPLERFLAVLGEGIHEHNTRIGRRGLTAGGRSFAEVFDESYASVPIRKATEAQRRLWLTGAEGIRADGKTGLIRFMGNEYYAEWLLGVAGERLTVRFDPADLFGGVHVYALSGEYLGHAPCRAKAGFFDVDEARAHAKARRDFMKAEKAALEAARRVSVTDLGALLDRAAGSAAPPPAPEAKVVKPVFSPARARPPVEAAVSDARHEALVASFAEAAARRPVREDEGALGRFGRALELEARLDEGTAVGADDQRWLEGYRAGPEYRAQRRLYDQFGAAMFG